MLPTEALPGPEGRRGRTAAWQQSLTRPGDARNRVLVALERNRVVGFAMTGPGGDPDCDPVADAELTEFTVDPGRAPPRPRLAAAPGGRGHHGADRFSQR